MMRPQELTKRACYVQKLYAPEDAGLLAVRERLVTAGRWGVNIGANEGKIIQLLMKLASVRKVVEIGTLFGYSGVWIARALPADGHLFTIERDHECVRMARKAFEECGVDDRVTILEGDAQSELSDLSAQGPFDMVFIDANKSAYHDYLKWAVDNTRSGGLIVGDNTLLGGGVVENEKPDCLSVRQWTEMRKFNAELADESRFFSTILPTDEGLSVAIRS